MAGGVKALQVTEPTERHAAAFGVVAGVPVGRGLAGEELIPDGGVEAAHQVGQLAERCVHQRWVECATSARSQHLPRQLWAARPGKELESVCYLRNASGPRQLFAAYLAQSFSVEALARSIERLGNVFGHAERAREEDGGFAMRLCVTLGQLRIEELRKAARARVTSGVPDA